MTRRNPFVLPGPRPHRYLNAAVPQKLILSPGSLDVRPTQRFWAKAGKEVVLLYVLGVERLTYEEIGLIRDVFVVIRLREDGLS